MRPPSVLVSMAVISLLFNTGSQLELSNFTSSGLLPAVSIAPTPPLKNGHKSNDNEERSPVGDIAKVVAKAGSKRIAEVAPEVATKVEAVMATEVKAVEAIGRNVRAPKKQKLVETGLPGLSDLNVGPKKNFFYNWMDAQIAASEYNPNKRDVFKEMIDTKYGVKTAHATLEKFTKLNPSDAFSKCLLWLYEEKHPVYVFNSLARNFYWINPTYNSWVDKYFTIWEKYIQWYNMKCPNQQTTIFKCFKEIFTKPGEFNNIMTNGLKSDSTSLQAKRLQWLAANTKPSEVLTTFSSQYTHTNLMKNKNFGDWYCYYLRFNEKYPLEAKSLSEYIDAYFKEKNLATTLEKALQIRQPNPTEAAKRKITRWLEEKKDPAVVFKTLGVNTKGVNYFTIEKMPSWIKYVDDYAMEYPNQKENLLDILSVSDTVLIDMAYAEYEYPRKFNHANSVLDKIIKKWVRESKSPQDILTLLDLKDAGANLFASPRFFEWLKFVDFYNNLHEGSQASTIAILLDAFDKGNNGALMSAFEHEKPSNVLRRLLKDLNMWKTMNKDNKEFVAYLKEYMACVKKKTIDFEKTAPS